MGKRQQEGILPFKVVQSDVPLITRAAWRCLMSLPGR